MAWTWVRDDRYVRGSRVPGCVPREPSCSSLSHLPLPFSLSSSPLLPLSSASPIRRMAVRSILKLGRSIWRQAGSLSFNPQSLRGVVRPQENSTDYSLSVIGSIILRGELGDALGRFWGLGRGRSTKNENKYKNKKRGRR